MPDLKQHNRETLPAPVRAPSKSSLHGSADWIRLTHLARALVADGFTDKPVDYARIYRAVLSGAIPAEQVITNRWSIRRADLPVVASALGLMPAAKVEKPGRAHRAAAAVPAV